MWGFTNELVKSNDARDRSQVAVVLLVLEEALVGALGPEGSL